MSRHRRKNQLFSDSLEALSEKPKQKITGAQIVQIVQMIWDNSQGVKNQVGHCPLLIFGDELARQLNVSVRGIQAANVCRDRTAKQLSG